MKIAIYSPYLDTAGGGEKYILTIAEILSKQFQVDILLDKHLKEVGQDLIVKKNSILHKINFSKMNFVEAPIGSLWSFLQRFRFFKMYDFLFYLTDGSIFFATAKKNIIHFQVPFENIKAKGLWGNIKLKSWNLAIYNSNFTKKLVEETWPINGEVIYPPVDTALFKPRPKKKQIISVGRFFHFNKAKKHQLLIDCFKKLNEENHISDWSLHLAGGAQDGDRFYIEQLKNYAKGFKIYFYPNLPQNRLTNLYGESQIYWHATGFDEDDPKKYEHFGITTVEAMASGCVPVVINLGGQKEIVEDGKSGFLWDDLVGLRDKTIKIINNKKLNSRLAKEAQKRSKKFDKQEFEKKINHLIYGKI